MIRRLVAALFSVLLLAAAQTTVRAAAPCDDSHFWRCTSFDLGSFKPTSVATEGASLFAMDPPAAQIKQIRFEPNGGFTIIDMPWMPVLASTPPAEFGQIVLGPKAFYAILTFPTAGRPETSVPFIFRAERVPTAIRGGWRLLRQTAGPADLGLSATVMNRTVWMLRSCQVCVTARGRNASFGIDWQPLASEHTQILAPPGPTIDLGNSVDALPAAGVTATREALYVFGGDASDDERAKRATRIPLKNGRPGERTSLEKLPYPRQGATALLHGTTIYLVGGNDPGDPIILRGKIRSRDPLALDKPGNIRTADWEQVPDPALPPGVKIVTAIFARGDLWIFRDDGRAQRANVADLVPGRSRLTWDRTTALITRPRPAGGTDVIFSEPIPPQPIRVRRGDAVDVTLDWSYSGSQFLDPLTVDISSAPVNPCVRTSPRVLNALGPAVPVPGVNYEGVRIRYNAGVFPLVPPTTAGAQIELQTVIPTTAQVLKDGRCVSVPDRRNEYNAVITINAGGQSLGPVQRLRFVVEKPPR